METNKSGPVRNGAKYVMRHLVAVTLIPVGVALGVGGLIQYHYRRLRAGRAGR
ncbi:hypothetical protein ACFL4G_12245 [Thermodesulfobacteriota bacterium]